MKSSLLSIFAATLLFLTSFAQEKDKFAKLKSLYEQEKYEDCAYKAENFTFKESTRKAPEPYLFMSMCNFRISEIEEKAEEYPKAYADAFKYASKCRSKDKSGDLYEEYKDYFTELKQAGVKDAMNFYHSNNFRKASSTLKKVWKFTTESDAIRFAKGVCDVKSNNMGEGGLYIKESSINLQKQLSSNSFIADPDVEELFADAFVFYSDFLMENNQPDSAKATMELGKGLLGSNTKVAEQYAKIVP